MQSWARRGVQAALVTGGMLAAGTGVASASENCPERPTSPFGGPLTPAEAAGDGTPSRSGVCFAGELFPDTEETLVLPALDGDGERVSRLSEADTLVGSIAPIRETPAEADNERTLRIPRITDELAPDLPREEQWIPPQELPDPTGHSAPSAGRGEPWGSAPESSAVSSTVPQDRVSAWTAPAERPRARHAAAAEEARPADGPHRSVSWSGALAHETVPVSGHSGEESAETARHALVLPEEEVSAPASSSPAEGIISMWRGSGGMLDTAAVDLTTVGFETGPDLRAVPERVLRSAVSTDAGQRRAVSEEKAPLDLPGEVHQRVDELPTLPDPALLFPTEDVDGAGGFPPDTGISLSGEDEANTLGGNTDEVGSAALTPVRDSGEAEVTRTSEEVLFTPVPELSEVSVRVVDELAAAVPERRVVTSNPFRETTIARRGAPEGGVALPILDRAPQVDALEGMTVPLPAVEADGTPRVGAAGAAA